MVCQSVEEQVDCLIDQATDDNLLVRAFSVRRLFCACYEHACVRAFLMLSTTDLGVEGTASTRATKLY